MQELRAGCRETGMPGSRGVPAIGRSEDWSLVLPDIQKAFKEGRIKFMDEEVQKRIKETLEQFNKQFEDGRAESTAL